MNKTLLRVSLMALCLAVTSSFAAARDPKQRYAFEKANPCPATGKNYGACKGYVVDHIKPICLGGTDTPTNMQWQEYKASLVKDAQERRDCAAARKAAKAKPIALKP